MKSTAATADELMKINATGEIMKVTADAVEGMKSTDAGAAL